MILKCNCKHEYQDAAHGKGKRAHTPMVKEPKGDWWRCTVCKSEKTKQNG